MKTSTVNLTWKRLCVLFSFVTLSFTQLLVAAPILNCNNINVTISCTTPLDETPKPSVTSNCGSAAEITLTYEDDLSRLDDCGLSGIIIRTYTATDACSETAICVQTITVTNEAPVLICINLDQTIACADGRGENDLPRPTVTDDCTAVGNTTLTFVDDFSGLDNCGDAGIFTRTWTVTDVCGNYATCVQTITVTNEAPVLNCSGYTNLTITCSDDINNIPIPTVTDDCTPTNNIALEFVDDNSGLSDCGHAGVIIRTYTATDACGLTSTCVQTITIDNQAPVLTCNSLDVTIACNAPRGENDLPIPIVSDDCSDASELTLTFVDNDSNLNNCTGFFTRTWTATDACGLTSTCVQTISILNESALNVPCTPDNFTMECNGLENNQSAAQAWNQANMAKLTLCSFSSCGGINVTSDYDFNNLADLCGFTGVLTVNYIITDTCGNRQIQNARMSIEDTTDPTVACDPVDEVHECNGRDGNSFAVLAWNQANISALANCATDICGGITVTSDYDFNNLTDACGLTGTVTVTYTITDECGNSVTKVATFTIVDTTGPFIGCFPTNVIVNCNDVPNVKEFLMDWDQKNFEKIINCNVDGCSLGVGTTSNFDSSVISDNCQSKAKTTVTYTASDFCGNRTIIEANYTIVNRDLSNPLCANLNVQSFNNQLSINNITAPNPIVKIFDPNWQLISECSGDCPEIITLSNLIAGEIYHTDIQLYDEDWQFICEDKQDIEIIGAGEPCDTSVCQGNLFLKTQAEVDAFCGCEVIEGDVFIGNADGGDFPETDILNLSTFGNTRIIRGSFVLGRTKLKNFRDLESLESVERTFTTVFNNQLENYLGLNKLKFIGELVAMTNPKLQNFSGLDNLTSIKNTIYINGNQTLNSLDGLNQLNTCGSLDLVKCPLIKSLEGLDNLKKVERNFVVRENEQLKNTNGIEALQETGTELIFINNPNLQTINGLDNFRSVGGSLVIQNNHQLALITGLRNIEQANQLVIRENPNLSDCCAITHLIDNDPDNGQVLNVIQIEQNLSFCNSPEEILQACQTPPCDTTICRGDVVLRTQAEVDAFCGCEVIEGDLKIGVFGFPNDIDSDIFNLGKLTKIKLVKGFVNIAETELKNLDGLNNLEYVGKYIYVGRNPILKNFLGLNNLEKVEGALVIDATDSLSSLKGLYSLKYVDNLLLSYSKRIHNLNDLESLEYLGGLSLQNTFMNDLSKLNQISNTKIRNISIANDSLLGDLNGFEKFDTIEVLTLGGNPYLEDISGLLNLNYVSNALFIESNKILTSCCSIKHLLDEDLNNGLIDGVISIKDNPQFCNSPEAILQACQTPLPTCENIQILTENNQIVIQGLTAPNEIIKVFDKDFNIVYQCVANCEERQMAGTFPVGNYTVDLQLYDEDWVLICAEQRGVMVESGNGNPCDVINCETIAPILANIPEDITAECDAVPSEPLNVTATDNCDDNVTIQFDETRTDGSCVDNYTLTRTWTAFDDCGNSASSRHVITIVDSIDPILANIPADITVECDSVSALSENVTATDNCDSDVEVTFTEERMDGNCSSNYQLIRTWTATDNCGNTATARQVMVVGDFTAPVLTNLPPDLTFNASDGFDTTFPIGIDNCDPNPTLTVEDAINSTETEIVRTFTTTDNCGNYATAQQIITIIQDGNNLCDALEITTTNGEIRFRNIDAPNSIVKVFDANYQIIFDCTATCENELVVPVEGEGIYHTDVQFYDENWMFICKDRHDIEVVGGSEPCDTSICQGNVVLQTQAEVDAFCGCEVIEGYLHIGLFQTDDSISDITSLNSLNELKIVKGSLSIVGTQLSNLIGLDNLIKIDLSLGITNNIKLINLKGLNVLQSVGTNLLIWNNSVLENLDDLENFTVLGGQINLINNDKINSIKGLSTIQETSLIYIIDNDNLLTLEGLESIDSIDLVGVGLRGLVIKDNINLRDINSLKNIKLVVGDFTISGNANLDDCCSIAHLVDHEVTNGSVEGKTTIIDNANFCNSPILILQNCQNTPISPCDLVEITTSDIRKISIQNLVAPIEILKVFDNDYNLVFECFADCTKNEDISNLNPGLYHININFYDENWQLICEKTETVRIRFNTQNRNTNLVPTDFTLFPNPAKASTTIDLSKLKGEPVQLVLYNQFGQVVSQQNLAKIGEGKVEIDLSTVANGLYILQIDTKGRRNVAKKLIVNKLY